MNRVNRANTPLHDWYKRLRTAVVGDKEPASRSYRYMSRLIEQEFGGKQETACLAFFSPDEDAVTANALLMLAYCLRSELDSRVLIVDARLRDPAAGITGRLGLVGAPGYADVMREGFNSRFDLIRKTAVVNVDVLPSGSLGPAETVGVDRDRWRDFLNAASARYKHVLVQVGSVMTDTRSLLMVADADAVFVIAQENRTLMKDISDSRKLLLSNGVNNLRVVMATCEQ